MAVATTAAVTPPTAAGTGSMMTTNVTTIAAAAIDVLTRALNTSTTSTSDAQTEASATAARSFLDQTGSVYVLDSNSNSNSNSNSDSNENTTTAAAATTSRRSNNGDSGGLKIFGCWNFLHQALNEIERHEDDRQFNNHNNKNNTKPLYLLPETRLLAEFAIKVARRSDIVDQQMVTTCIKNYCCGNNNNIINGGTNTNTTAAINNNNGSNSSINDNHIRFVVLPQLIQTNIEIREIVTGRIAAYAFHHKNTNTSSGSNTTTALNSPTITTAGTAVEDGTSTSTTVFADPLVIESFCKFLAVNAISNGPQNLQLFLKDWIIPGATAAAAAAVAINNDDNDDDDECYYNDNDDNGDNDDGTTASNKRQRLIILASQAASSMQQQQHQPSPPVTSSRMKTTTRKRNRTHHHYHHHNRLPPYSLACVLYHLASSSSSSAVLQPYGTVDIIQRLSVPVMANVLLGPVLHHSLVISQQRRMKRQEQQQRKCSIDDDDDDDNDTTTVLDRTIAMGIQTIYAWCKATDLSLAQVKHIGSKVQINLVEILGEALQTDSPKVMHAIADLIEFVVERHITAVAATAEQTTITKGFLSHQKQKLISDARMKQTRYLMQVDKISFQSNVTQEQLYTIETKELGDILHDLSTYVENQRHRFPSFLSNQADSARKTYNTVNDGSNRAMISNEERAHSLGYSLARIVAAVCLGYGKVYGKVTNTTTKPSTSGTASLLSSNNIDDGGDEEKETSSDMYQIPGSGFLDLIWQCASHPSIVICGIVLPVVTPALRTEVGLAIQWLPTLQRRAIILHQLCSSSRSSTPSISNHHNVQGDINSIGEYDGSNALVSSSDVCLIEFDEFIQFRETVLTDSLIACYGIHSEYYLASCTAAIEEFCCGSKDNSDDSEIAGTADTENAEQQTSFHLEAALFCITAVAEQVLPSIFANTGNSNVSNSTVATSIPDDNFQSVNASTYLLRCTTALAKKSRSLYNPLTMAQACRFVHKYSKWFCLNQNHGMLDISTDLILFVFSQCCTNFPDTGLSRTIHRQSNSDYKPFSQAAKTLRCLLISYPVHFLSNIAISALGAGWEATFVACNRSGGKLFTIEDRKDTCIGICHVLASLPNDQQETSLMALALASIACLEAMVKKASEINYINDPASSAILSAVLKRVADEIIIIATTVRAFTDALPIVIEGTRDSADGISRTCMAKPSLTVLRRAWPTISIAVSKFSFNDSILDSLEVLFGECIPPKYNHASSITFLQEICTLSKNIIENEDAPKSSRFFHPILTFIEQSIEMYGKNIDDKILLVAIDDKNGNRDTSLVTEIEREIFQCLESLTGLTIDAMVNRRLLGHNWTLIQKQGNGESASETTTKDSDNGRDLLLKSSSIGLAPLFSVLSKFIALCPAFLFRILSGPTTDCSNSDIISDLSMLRETMGSAVSSILHSETKISIQAMKFIESIVSLTQVTPNTATARNYVTSLTNEYNLRCKAKGLRNLFEGICGIFQPTVIPFACRLLLHALSSPTMTNLSPEKLKSVISQGLSREYFSLGDKAWKIVYEFCVRCSMVRTKVKIDEVESIMADVWQLHRFENSDLMAKSDAVYSFYNRYSY